MNHSKFQAKQLSQNVVVNVVLSSQCRLRQQIVTKKISVLLRFFVTFVFCSQVARALPATPGHMLSEFKEKQGGIALQTIPLKKQYVPVLKNGKTVAYKTAYFGNVAVGSPQLQTFTAVFDTGSGHFILPSTTCSSDACAKHRRYNRSLSSSAIEINNDATPVHPDDEEREQVTISFGTGEVLGEFVQDNVCVGKEYSLCMSLRVVSAIEMTPDPFSLFDFDGVIGLGLDALTLNPGFSFFRQLMNQNPKLVPQFAVFMALSPEEDSTISFGGYDPEYGQSQLQWAPVTRPELGHWQVQILAMRIGNRSLDECADGTCRAILDTGTSLLGVPQQMARNLHRRLTRPVPKERLNTDTKWDEVDCRTVPGQPMEFDLEGGITLRLSSEDYSRPAAVRIGTDDDKVFCRSLLLPLDLDTSGARVFIWGEPVLRRYYTVYDLGAKKIGFTLAKSQARTSMQTVTDFEIPPAGQLISGAPLPNFDKSSGPLVN